MMNNPHQQLQHLSDDVAWMEHMGQVASAGKGEALDLMTEATRYAHKFYADQFPVLADQATLYVRQHDLDHHRGKLGVCGFLAYAAPEGDWQVPLFQVTAAGKVRPAACACAQCEPFNPMRPRMILCGTCGNKRCPHATDHRLACTGSNEPGQLGSSYGIALPHQAPYQDRVGSWMLACFGQAIAADCKERNHRFLEEALELVQSCGCTADEAKQLVDYVYGRPVGEIAQEVGGVMVTLAALCLAQDVDMQKCAEDELARIWTKVEQIRAKQAAKPKASPLPQAAGPTVADYEEVLASQAALARELDVLLNGEQGAALRPKLCDIVAQVRGSGLRSLSEGVKVIEAARRLVKAKGRYHTELNYRELAAAIADLETDEVSK
jgi:hypothetical protein